MLRTFLNLPALIALGTPFPLTVLKATITSIAYKREHLVNFRVAAYSIIAGVPGIVLGSYLTAYLSGKFLMLLTAFVLFFVGIDFIIKTFKEKTHTMKKPFSQPPVHYIVSLAIAIGILSGVLANGGGIFFVPAYVILFRMKIKEAIATSLLTVIVMALPGSIIHHHLGHIDLAISTSMGIGVIPMAFLGAKLDIRTRDRQADPSCRSKLLNHQQHACRSRKGRTALSPNRRVLQRTEVNCGAVDGASTLVPNIEFSPGQVPQGMPIAAAGSPAGACIANSTALFRLIAFLLEPPATDFLTYRRGRFVADSRNKAGEQSAVFALRTSRSKGKPQKIEGDLRIILFAPIALTQHHSGFQRMQFKPTGCKSFPQPLFQGFRLRSTPAMQNAIIGIALKRNFGVMLPHPNIEHIM